MQKAELKLWFKLFCFRLLMAVCTFSASHPDELWQFHEPAHFTVFNRGHLTWDWRARIRSFVFPLPLIIFFYIAKVVGSLGFVQLEDFIVQVAPLLLKAFWSSLTDIFTYKLSRKYFGPLSGKWALLFTLASPAQADIGNRALSNSLETALCSVAAYTWPINRKEWNRLNWIWTLTVLGLACLVRVSAIQMFLPATLFLFLYAPSAVEVIFTALPVVVCVVLLGTAVDSLLYREFTVSWWNFFQWNVVKNVSSHFGVESAFFYFETIKSSMIGMTVLPFTAFGLFKAFKSFKMVFPFFFFIVPYFVFSSIQPHKEHRFILPILPFLLAYSAYGGQQIEVFLYKRNRLIKLCCQITLIGIVWFNSWKIIKMTSLQAVGPWNAIQDLRGRINATSTDKSGGIFLLANCHNFPNYGVFHLNYPLTFIPCTPPFSVQFFINDADFNFQLDMSMYYHSGMIRETIEFFSKNNPSKLPPKYIVAIGYTFLNNRNLLEELGYRECGRHTSYILDQYQGRESSINDVYIVCHEDTK
jgi:GPI mannosyltransferase 3